MRALTLRVSANLALALAAVPAVAQSYEAGIVPSQINGSPTSMVPLQLGDDATRKVDLGFEFTYWDQTFTSAWVSSNGFVSFQSSSHLCCNGVPIEQAPRNTIYGLWTDLISYTGNPYYKRSEGSILFGWYGTQEYGTQNKETFEIGLFQDGKIQFNYGSLSAFAYHTATAGITGPTYSDNVLLFYGRDPRPMQNMSGVLRWVVPEPVVTVDCTVTPLDPSCPPQMVAPVQVITSPTVETIADAAREDTVADQAEIAAAAPEPEQTIEVAVAAPAQTEAAATTEAQSITEQVAAAVAAETAKELPVAERLTPDQVAALAAPPPAPPPAAAEPASQVDLAPAAALAQDTPAQPSASPAPASVAAQDTSPQVIAPAEVSAPPAASASFDAATTTAPVSPPSPVMEAAPDMALAQANGVPVVTFRTDLNGIVNNPVAQGGPSTPAAVAATLDAATSASSPSSVSNTLEALNMTPAPAPQMASSQGEQVANAMADGQGATMDTMAAVPGFSAYTQVALQDRPDFYAIRDIYRNRRLRDANFEMYRMTQTNSAKWREMVDEQYGR